MTTILRAARELESGERGADAPRAAWTGWRSIAVASVALAAGAVAIGVLVFSTRAPRAVASVRRPAPVPARPAPLDTDEPPWAQVTPTGAAAFPTAPPSPARAAPADPVSNGNEPRVRVASIAYRELPRQRSVTLVVDGARVSLHEGESARGVEVQLILPGSVYLRHGAAVFAVDAAR